MTPENFTYWLNGFIELTEGEMITPEQWVMIKDHLQLVLKKDTRTFEQILKDHAHRVPLTNTPLDIEKNRITC